MANLIGIRVDDALNETIRKDAATQGKKISYVVKQINRANYNLPTPSQTGENEGKAGAEGAQLVAKPPDSKPLPPAPQG